MDAWQQHQVENFRNVHNIMEKGPSHYTRDSSCYKSCCYDASTNTFLGNYDGLVKTRPKRQTCWKSHLRHALVDIELLHY